MDKQLKIVYLIPGGLVFPGGMERITVSKANYLADKMGYHVSIVTTEQLGRPVYFQVSDRVHLHHLDIGIHVNFGKESYLKKVFSRFFKIRQYRRELDRLLKEIRPDITISLLGLDIEFLNELKDGSLKLGELHFPGDFRTIMARKLSDAFVPNWVAKVRTDKLKRDCRKLTRLIVLTEEERSAWKDKTNISVIPNFLNYFPESTSSCEEKRAIAVGRTVYEKGFDQLIDAWKDVYTLHPDWQLDIFGSGDQKDILKEQIRKNGLESVVFIHEPDKKIYEQYLKHSMILFPSRYLDALPMVLIEAMSCGLPIVAFDAPCGPKDIIAEGENGFLVPSGDKSLFAKRINTMIEQDEMRKKMGGIAREMSMEYSEEKVMRKWLALFEELVDKKL